ncbi:MAG TPA: PDC sensor domain-containing protein, partial [Vicinamibacterales bacterium]|nr:PDC sensor domain-containing protein [Vicinamibacterales bacterium]
MQFLRNQPIRRQVVAVSFAITVPFAALVVWSANRARLDREAEVTQEAATLAATTAAFLDQYLASVDSMASALLRHPAILAFDRAESDRLLADVLRDQHLLLNIVLSDASGALKGTALPERGSLGPIMLPYLRDVVARNAPVISELTTGAVTGK